MKIINSNFLWHWHLLPQILVAFLECMIHHNAIISSETPRCEDVMFIFLNLVNFPTNLPFLYALINN